MNPRTLRLIIISSLVAIGIAATVGLAAAAAPNVADVIALVERPASAGDAFPAAIAVDDLGDGGLVAQSSRRLGASGKASFWVALDRSSKVCLVVLLDDQKTAGSACTTAAIAERRGIIFGFSGNEREPNYRALVAVLLPDSAQAPADEAWTRIGDNLLVTEQDTFKAGDELVIDRKAGRQGEPLEFLGG